MRPEGLLDHCADKRVSVVLARQELLKELVARPTDAQVIRAAEVLDHVLGRLPLA